MIDLVTVLILTFYLMVILGGVLIITAEKKQALAAKVKVKRGK